LHWRNVDPKEELEEHERLYKTILKGEQEAELTMHRHLNRVANIASRAVKSSTGSGGR
jgi:DNA-binding FadR family transcriptional regulator